MEGKQIKQKIDSIVEELTESLEKIDGIESIALTGTYVIGDISFERPNVNVLLFLKPNLSPDTFLEIGKSFFRVGTAHINDFSFRLDPWPWRFSYPIGEKELELSIFVGLLNLQDKDLEAWITPRHRLWTPFGIPTIVLEGFKSMRKVIYGRDVLGEMELKPTLQDVALHIIRDFSVFRLQMMRMPLSYDISKRFDLLATESLECGKAALYSGSQLLLTEEEFNAKKYIEFFKDKNKLLEFIGRNKPEWLEPAKFIVKDRENFLSVKQDREKSSELYRQSYTLLNQVFFTALQKLR